MDSGRCVKCPRGQGTLYPQSTSCSTCNALANTGDAFSLSLAYQLCKDPFSTGDGGNGNGGDSGPTDTTGEGTNGQGRINADQSGSGSMSQTLTIAIAVGAGVPGLLILIGVPICIFKCK